MTEHIWVIDPRAEKARNWGVGGEGAERPCMSEPTNFHFLRLFIRFISGDLRRPETGWREIRRPWESQTARARA